MLAKGERPEVSIIIPAFNEEENIDDVLSRTCKAAESSTLSYEVIFVDDGSTDKSAEQIRAFGNQIIFLQHEKNQGKGAAIRTGLSRCGGDAVIIQDADLEYDPGEWTNLLAKFNPPLCPVVYGSRNLKPGRQGYRTFVWGVWFLTKLINLLRGSKLTDAYTCYKLFDTNLLKSLNLESQGFEFEAEVTMKILKRGVKIVEVPIGYVPRKFDEGKKINFWDGWRGIKAILKYNFKD